MTVDHSKNIIEVQGVSFGYTNELALKNIDLNVHAGDYLGIIGPNGGGKTTLLKIMLGLLQPTEGSVKLFGQPMEKFKAWPRIGYVPQKAVQFDAAFPATVEEVVAMGRAARRGLLHPLTQMDREKITNALVQVDLAAERKRLIGDLSGGQQQRVFIARALAGEPEVIFLDEPTAGVDVKAQEQFYALLKKFNQTLGLTLLLVSHDIDVVANEATELACINQALVYHGAPQAFVKGDYLNQLYGKETKFILHDH
ncbi:MAG: metal ABC transporter ATP-binding protein [Candidatus Magasanikbacteria bacterium]|nr:metal ABC transporter ATP-binding protein [Candidatus Magasanikbacteria bacterium]